MRQQGMTEKRSGFMTYFRLLFLLFISLFLLRNNAFADDALRVSKLFEIKSTADYRFEQPSNFSVDTDGNIYILNDLKEMVMKYNAKGKFLLSFGSHTNTNVSLYQSYNIACDDYNLIHIFDPYESSVRVFTSDGNLKQSIQLDFDDELEHKVTELAFLLNSYFLIDNKNNYLYIFDTKGHITKRIGKKGELKEEFMNPFSMSFDQTGRLYITDVLNARVQVFATTGKYINQIADFGFTGGGVFRPNGVAVDSENNVYISDVFLGVIYVFETDGTYIAPLKIGDAVLKLTTPARIKIYQDKLYVLEMQRNALSVYKIL